MRIPYFALTLLFFTTSIFAQAPTIPTVSVEVRDITGQSMRLTIERGNGEKRIVVISDSPVTGLPVDMIDYNPDLTFGDGDPLNPDEFVMYDGIVPNFDVFTGFVPATEYFISVFEYNGVDQGTEYLTTPTTTSFMTLGQPTQQVDNVMVTEITGNSAKFTWDNGNGDGRLVVFRENEEVTANPVDLESYGNLGSNWRGGDEITPGNRVMYNIQGSSNTFTAVKLEPSKLYYYDIFEFAGTGNGKVYAVPGKSGFFMTDPRPTEVGTLVAANLNLPREGDRFPFRFSSGDGEGQLFVLKEGNDLAGVQPTEDVRYSANSIFGNGDEVSPGAFVVIESVSRSINGGLSFPTTIRGLEPNTTYTLGAYEFDYDEGFNDLIRYQMIAPVTLTFTTAAAPTQQATMPLVINNTGPTADVTYTRGNGDAALVALKAGSAVDFVPIDTDGYGSSFTFGASQGDVGGGNYVVYRGANQPTTTRGLTPGTRYHGAIWEYNGNAGPVYARPPARFEFVAALTPSESASDMDFRAIEGDRMNVGWKVGNGQRRVLVAKQGSPVSTEPQDGTARYDDGDQTFGMGDPLGDDNFVVFDGNFNGVNQTPVIKGMDIATVYHFALFEYNEDSAGNTYYRRLDPATGSQSTAVAPTTPPADLGPFDMNAVSISFDIPAGNGEERFLVVRNADPVNFVPDNLTRYNPTRLIYGDAPLGDGNSAIAYNKVNGGNPRVENLLANTTYQAAVFEMNGRLYPVYNPDPTRYTFTTPSYATENSTVLETRNLGALQLQLQAFRGNGSSRIVVARLASSPATLPQDGTVYTVNETFGAGLDLGNGNYVVASESLFRPDNRVIFDPTSGLEADTDYVFTSYEVVSDGSDRFYAVPGTELAVTTSAEPTVAPINLQINDILNESATIAWTTGNGLGEVALVSEGRGNPVSQLVETGTKVQPTTASSTSQLTMVGNAQPVYFGEQTFRNLTSLKTGTLYHVQLQAYNGWRESPAYQQVGVIDSFRTLGPPEDQASDLSIISSTDTRITLRWRKGGGTDRILVAKEGSMVDAEPVDNIEYTPNTFFSSGDDLGNMNYVIAAGDFDTVSVTDLTPGLTYHFAVYEYNIQNTVLYNRMDPPRVSGAAEFFLPVTLYYFRGKAIKEDAHLAWSTEEEVGADRFVIERSVAGDRFKMIGEIRAVGVGDYNFVDPGLAAGHYLYRLRQLDLDGTYEYSKAVGITIGGEALLSAYPNPVTETLHIQGADAGTKYVIRDGRGGAVRSGTWSGRGIDVSALPSGSYVLWMGERSVKVIKL